VAAVRQEAFLRKWIIVLAMLLAALALSAGADLPADASASTATSPSSQTTVPLVPLNFKPVAGGPKVVGIPVQTASAKAVCGKSAADLSAYAARGIAKVGCLQPAASPAPGTHPATGTQHAAAVPSSTSASSGNALWCESDTADEWWLTRTTGCLYSEPFTFTLVDTETDEPIGSAALTFSDSIVLSPSSSEFTETNYITMVSNDNVPELLVTYAGLCDSLCAPLDPTAEDDAVLTDGSTVSGTTTYNDAPSSQTLDATDLSQNITMSVPGGVPLSPVTGVDPATIRCDNGLISSTSTTTGCVYPQVDPTVLFSLSSTGSTAAIDDWAMTEEDAHWGDEAGDGSPLTRITNSSTIDANRAAICGSFVTLYTGDSCEEYPFASSTQSGGNNGKTGADCAQVEAVNENGQWFIEELSNVTGSEPCVVGHADTTSQNSQGGTLSTFYQTNRVIAGDNFWVSISS
jgi:hypothetical protein